MEKRRDNIRNSDMSNWFCSVSDELVPRAVAAAEMNKSHRSEYSSIQKKKKKKISILEGPSLFVNQTVLC